MSVLNGQKRSDHRRWLCIRICISKELMGEWRVVGSHKGIFINRTLYHGRAINVELSGDTVPGIPRDANATARFGRYCSPRDTLRSVVSQALLMCSEQLRDNILRCVISPPFPPLDCPCDERESARGNMRRLRPVIFALRYVDSNLSIYASRWTIVTYFENIVSRARYRCRIPFIGKMLVFNETNKNYSHDIFESSSLITFSF